MVSVAHLLQTNCHKQHIMPGTAWLNWGKGNFATSIWRTCVAQEMNCDTSHITSHITICTYTCLGAGSHVHWLHVCCCYLRWGVVTVGRVEERRRILTVLIDSHIHSTTNKGALPKWSGIHTRQHNLVTVWGFYIHCCPLSLLATEKDAGCQGHTLWPFHYSIVTTKHSYITHNVCMWSHTWLYCCSAVGDAVWEGFAVGSACGPAWWYGYLLLFDILPDHHPFFYYCEEEDGILQHGLYTPPVDGLQDEGNVGYLFLRWCWG